MTKFRAQGNLGPKKTIIGCCYKLLPNSSYGILLIDKTKYSNVKYISDKAKIYQVINSNSFKSLEELSHINEVETYKKFITLDDPIEIGVFILQYAKLRVFKYECLSTYMSSDSFELIEMDIDSIYMALNTPTLDECIKKEYMSQYLFEINHRCSDNLEAFWFPRKCCDKHKRLHKICKIYREI